MPPRMGMGCQAYADRPWPDNGPANRFAERGAKDRVAEKVPIVDEPGRRDIRRRGQGGPRRTVPKVTLEDRRGREGTGGVSGRKGTAFSSWSIALNRVFDPVDHALGHDLRANKVESEVRELVCFRAVRRRDDIPPNQPQTTGRADLERRASNHSPQSEEVFSSLVS